MSKRIGSAVLVLASLLAMIGGVTIASPASAEPVSKTQRVEMVRTGVNHAVAKANGFEVRTDSKGVEYSVPAGTPIGVNGNKEGPCGWSWFEWVDVDFWGRRASIYSGFEIRPGWQPAVFIETWNATVIDDAGVSSKPLAPALGWVKNLMVWVSPRHRFGSSVGGWVYGEITAGVVVLRDGTICFPLGPNDGVWLSS